MHSNADVVLLDAYSQIYRSYHAIPRLTNSHGEPTNCIFGMASFILRLEEMVPAGYAAAVFDKGIPAARMELLPEYKATRPAMPEDMQQQLTGIRTWMAAAGWRILEEDGREADDIIAAIVSKRDDRKTYIVSGDKDLAQLVNEGVCLMMPGQRGKLRQVGIQDVEEKWGVPAQAICDYLALVGDSSDNIKGVPGVGEKTATALLQQFGSLDEILHNLKDVQGKKLRAKLDEYRNLIQRNRALIRLTPDLPSDWEGFQSLRRGQPDWDRLRELTEYYEFQSLLQRLDKLQTAYENPELF